MDSRTEEELHGSNERFVAMLIDMARNDPSPHFEVTRTFAADLIHLDDASRQRMSRRPFLLIDFRLDDEPWWQTLEGTLTLPAPLIRLEDSAPSPLAGRRDNTPVSPSKGWASSYPRSAAVDIARQALVLTWHRATLHPLGATLNLGISPEVVRIFGRIKLAALEHIANVCVDIMQPRWQGRGIWQRLFQAAKKEDAQEMDFVDRLGAQLLATDLLRKR